jgi:hypothetical protein
MSVPVVAYLVEQTFLPAWADKNVWPTRFPFVSRVLREYPQNPAPASVFRLESQPFTRKLASHEVSDTITAAL